MTAALVTYPTPAAAEISDKVPSLGHIWCETLIGAGILLLTCRAGRWKLAIAALIVASFLSCFFIDDFLLNPYLGPHIRWEMGVFYIACGYASPIIIWMAGLAGLCLNVRLTLRIPPRRS